MPKYASKDEGPIAFDEKHWSIYEHKRVVSKDSLTPIQRDLGIEGQLFWYSTAYYTDEHIEITYENYYSPSAKTIIAKANGRKVRHENALHQGHWSDVVFSTWTKTCENEVQLGNVLVRDSLIRGLRFIVRAVIDNQKTLELINQFMVDPSVSYGFHVPVREQPRRGQPQKWEIQRQTFTPENDGFYGMSQAGCNENSPV